MDKVPNNPPRGVPQTRELMEAQAVNTLSRSRFSPIRGITPARVSSYLDGFDAGHLADLARLMDAVERRDPKVTTVASKRKKAVPRFGYEILTVDDSAEAQAHAEALKFFYDNLEATHVLDQDERGGWRTLVHQMADAIGKRFAVHEIVWQFKEGAPKGSEQPGAGGITAQFRFVPLWYFESSTGRLKFLKTDASMEGEPLKPGGWMVTTGDGIMQAGVVAWLYKSISLKDWLIYSERHGMPILHGITTHAKDSAEWDALEEALSAAKQTSALITNEGATITAIERGTMGELPWPGLVEAMDKYLTQLWRGGDLGTNSAKDSVGASLQEDESDILQEDDAAMIEETLWRQVERPVIEWTFGAGTMPLAYLKINRKPKDTSDQDLKVDEFLTSHGFPLSLEDAAERYGRRPADEGEPILEPRQAEADPEVEEDEPTANEAGDVQEALRAAGLQEVGRAFANDLQPFLERLSGVLELGEGEAGRIALERLQGDFPELLKQINASPEAGTALANLMGTAFVNEAGTGYVRNRRALQREISR